MCISGEFLLFFCNFIYFKTITKQVLSLILIMLVGTDVCVRMAFVWQETGVPGRNPPVWLGDHMTISHADAGYRTRVAVRRVLNTAPAKLQFLPHYGPWLLFSVYTLCNGKYIVCPTSCPWLLDADPFLWHKPSYGSIGVRQTRLVFTSISISISNIIKNVRRCIGYL